MDKKAIVVRGDPDLVPLCASCARAYLSKRRILRSDSFMRPLMDNVNRMFGLIFAADAYEGREDVLLPDFYGRSFEQVTGDFLSLMRSYGGAGVLGRLAGRRLRFETVFNAFLYEGYDCEESLIALSLERGLKGPENMLILNINDGSLPRVHAAPQRVLEVDKQDHELRTLMIHGSLKHFFNFTD